MEHGEESNEGDESGESGGHNFYLGAGANAGHGVRVRQTPSLPQVGSSLQPELVIYGHNLHTKGSGADAVSKVLIRKRVAQPPRLSRLKGAGPCCTFYVREGRGFPGRSDMRKRVRKCSDKSRMASLFLS